MKSFVKLIVLAIAVLPFFVACSGGGSSTPLFGSLVDQYEKYAEKHAELQKKAETITSEEEKAKLMKEAEKLDEEWSVKIEKAAKDLDGKTVEVEAGDFTIAEPISLTYNGFFSKSDLTPKFNVNGKLEMAKDINVKNKYARGLPVSIAGYDAEGNEVYATTIGYVEASDKDGVKVIAAGTPVTLGTLVFSENAENHRKAKSLKFKIEE